jgi:hypothetical protein
MFWKKLGNIFNTNNNHPWMISHASNTIARHLHDDVFRIYFSTRDIESRSHIAYIDLSIKSPYSTISVASQPLLTPGEIGAFDDSGVSLSCSMQLNEEQYFFYVGWNLGVTVPWRNSIGLAQLDKKTGLLKRMSRAPWLDRSNDDPFTVSYPFVLSDESLFRMYYGSNLRWGANQKDMAHIIKYAESKDGLNWERTGIISVGFKNENEYAISRPFVIKENNIYKMWYSYRGEAYRIGYAESMDGIHFLRKDEEAGIDVSTDGWDSEMICYPSLFDHAGERFMLYNGNGYGRTGFGLAKLITL